MKIQERRSPLRLDKLWKRENKKKERELKYEAENVFNYDKKETYKHYYENKLFELRLSEIMSFPIKKLMDEVIPTLKKQKQHERENRGKIRQQHP